MTGPIYRLSHEFGLAYDYTSFVNGASVTLESPGYNSTDTRIEVSVATLPVKAIRIFDPDFYFKTNSIRVKMFVNNQLNISNNKDVCLLRAVDTNSNTIMFIDAVTVVGVWFYEIRAFDDSQVLQTSTKVPMPSFTHLVDVSIIPSDVPLDGAVQIALNEGSPVTVLSGLDMGAGPGLKSIEVGVLATSSPAPTGVISFDEIELFYNDVDEDAAASVTSAGAGAGSLILFEEFT